MHATLYAGLRTNTTRENMSFSDYFFDASFPGAADSRQFCSHAEVRAGYTLFSGLISELARGALIRFAPDTDHLGRLTRDTVTARTQVLRFLQAFAAAFDLLRVVRTCVEVLAVRPAACSEIGTNGSTSGGAAAGPGSGQGRWEVVIKHVDAAASGDGASSRLTASEVVWHDAVVVCNGHFFEPRVPSFPGQAAFPGLLLHSHNYRRPEPFANQTGGRGGEHAWLLRAWLLEVHGWLQGGVHGGREQQRAAQVGTLPHACSALPRRCSVPWPLCLARSAAGGCRLQRVRHGPGAGGGGGAVRPARGLLAAAGSRNSGHAMTLPCGSHPSPPQCALFIVPHLPSLLCVAAGCIWEPGCGKIR